MRTLALIVGQKRLVLGTRGESGRHSPPKVTVELSEVFSFRTDANPRAVLTASHPYLSIWLTGHDHTWDEAVQVRG